MPERKGRVIDGQMENALLCFTFAYSRKASEIAFDLPLSDTVRAKRHKVATNAREKHASAEDGRLLSAIITDVQITRRYAPVRFAPSRDLLN